MTLSLVETPPFEIFTLPNGGEVHYRDSNHQYFKGQKAKPDGSIAGVGRLKGVSGAVGCFDGSPDNLMGWAAKLEIYGVSQLLEKQFEAWRQAGEPPLDGSELGWLSDPEAIIEALKANDLTWRDVRDQAAHRGTAVHKHALQALAMGQQVAFDELTEEESGYAQGITGFWLEYEPKVIGAELVVADLELGIAGRLDLLCELNGRTVILDAKTSKHLYSKMAVQVSGYALLAERSGYGKVEGGAVLQVFPDGTHKLIEFDVEPADFLLAVDVADRKRALEKVLRDGERAA
jgi:hypothetical protein